MPKSAGPLENRLLALGWQAEWFNLTEQQIERLAAPLLRKQRSAHLAHSRDPMATGFREALPETHEKEIAERDKEYVYGEDPDCRALAESVGCHVKITHIGRKGPTLIEGFTAELRDGNKNELAPTIYLTHHGIHWYQTGKGSRSASSDGNCLYNAFARQLLLLVQAERRQLVSTSDEVVLTGTDSPVPTLSSPGLELVRRKAPPAAIHIKTVALITPQSNALTRLRDSLAHYLEKPIVSETSNSAASETAIVSTIETQIQELKIAAETILSKTPCPTTEVKITSKQDIDNLACIEGETDAHYAARLQLAEIVLDQLSCHYPSTAAIA